MFAVGGEYSESAASGGGYASLLLRLVRRERSGRRPDSSGVRGGSSPVRPQKSGTLMAILFAIKDGVHFAKANLISRF